MIGPAELVKRADKWWPEVLRAHLENTNLFPREIPRIGKNSAAKSLADFDRIRREQAVLLPDDGQKYVLQWKEVNNRSIGTNRFVERITVTNREMYLCLVKKQTAFNTFVEVTDLIRTRLPQLENWLKNNPVEVLNHAENWPRLLNVVDYFLYRHEPNRYYIRELPIPIPTKFIESNKGILTSLLDEVLPEEAINTAHRGVKGFERRYGLKYRQPRVRLRILDKDIATLKFSGIDDLSLSLDQFSELNLPVQRAIILENKTNFSNLMNFLTLPQLPGTVGIFGSGFQVGNLKSAAWLHQVELLYWGDLDAHGLQIVNQLRASFPHLRTFLMDRATLDHFTDYHVTATPAATAELPNLTPTELELYDYLNDAGIRLEQEHIEQDWVKKALLELIS